MPTVSQRYDIKSLIEHYAQIQIAGQAIVKGVTEYHSNCPWCGGTDRFITRPETGQYTCATRASGCGRSGDGIDFLMDYAMMDRQEAVETLGLEDVSFFDAERPARRAQNSKDVAPPKKWQEAAMVLVARAERYLWHPDSVDGQKSLDYLHGRGLTDETIKRARLGCVPIGKDGRWYLGTFEDWGLNSDDLTEGQREKGGVRVPDGILIPWFVGGDVWKLAVKRPGQEMDYGQVMGSSEPLYNIDTVQYGEVAMMVEGEIDCLSVMQEAGDLVNCVATGSSGKGKTARWLVDLSLASFVLQSFDEDAAGDAGAEFWLETLPRIERWSPGLWKDTNDILRTQLSGENTICTLRQWVQFGVDMVSNNQPPPSNVSTLAREVQEEISEVFEPDEGVPPAEQPEDNQGLLAYASIMSRIVEVLGGLDKVTMTKHDGSSLADYARAHPEAFRQLYEPVTLPPLPREKCPHTVTTAKRVSDTMSIVTPARCRGKPLAHGWCELHAGSQTLLELGARLGYPEVNLGARVIGGGIGLWEGYAGLVSSPHVQDDIARICARYGVE